MKEKEDIESTRFALQEVKDHYNLVLESFNDIRGKNQILLFICSLLLTLPLSNNFIIEKLNSSHYIFIFLFITGLFCLTIALILLIGSIIGKEVNIPEVKSIRDSIGKYKHIQIMKAVLDKYIKDLDFNQRQIENKQKYIRHAEKFILAGITLIVVTIILILKGGVV